jgi:hypothetical protein
MRRHLDLRATLIALVALGSCIAPAAAEAQGYAYFALTPCRLLDTRVAPGAGNPGQTGWSGKLQNWQITFVTAKGNCGVPATGVEAISVNVTVVGAAYQGHIRVTPANAAALGLYSTINFTAADNAVANGAVIPIQSSGTTTGPAGPTGGFYPNLGIGDFGLYYGGQASTPIRYTDILVDVTGYFAP